MDKIDIDKLKTYIKEQKEQLNMFGYITTLENDLKRIEKLINAYENIQKEKLVLEFQDKQIKNYVEELKKYDYRNIKINEENKIKSPSFTKEQLDFMNLGITLYISIPKLLKDKEETNI